MSPNGARGCPMSTEAGLDDNATPVHCCATMTALTAAKNATWAAHLPNGGSHQATVEHWNAWQQTQNGASPRYTDWGDHPTILRSISREVLGDANTNILAYLKSRFPAFSNQHALSLCCGDGGFEHLLVSQGVFGSVHGIDASPARITAANLGASDLKPHLTFTCQDANAGAFGETVCDVVFAKAALHHIENLEVLVPAIGKALRPGGHLVTLDFFGPTRFQWTDAQIEATNWFLDNRVPPSLLQNANGLAQYRASRPTVQAMIDMDPSEAVRSSELYPLLQNHFELVMDLALGGTLLNLIFYGDVVNRFDPGNQQHDEVIEEAVAYERSLMAASVIGSDFRLIVATPRHSLHT